MTSQFSNITSSSDLLDVVLFLLSSLVTVSSFMSVLSLVLKLWQFSFIGDWPEIRKSEIPPSKFCSISEDWRKSGIPSLAWTSIIKCYWDACFKMPGLQVLPFLSSNRGKGGKFTPHTPTQIRHWVKSVQTQSFFWSVFFCIQAKYEPEKTPYLDTFLAVRVEHVFFINRSLLS